MNTLQKRAHSYSGSTTANRQQNTTDADLCPICGQPIAAIVSRAPGVHEIRPCGHELGPTGYSLATLTTREAALEDDRDRDDDQRGLIPDGGRISDRGEPDVECPECGAKYYGERGASACCPRLIPDGGQVTGRTQLDQQLGSILEAWITRDVPEDQCRFCNEALEDPESERYCDEDCESSFDAVLEARLTIGQRDLEERGFD